MYDRHWNEFYAKTYLEQKRKALWDVEPSASVGMDYERFAVHMDRDVPILDIGCGTGAPTVWLGRKFSKAIGVDAAPSAIAIAKATFPGGAVDFRCLDLAKTSACRMLHEELGDLNLYMRGVLHQIKDEDKPEFLENLSTLMGERGTLYFIEVASDIRRYFQEASPHFHRLPKAVQAVFISNLPPEGVSMEDIPSLFPERQFSVLESGNTGLSTNLSLPDGTQITIPAVYGIVRPAGRPPIS